MSHDPSRDHSNMLICCSRNIYYNIKVEHSCAASYIFFWKTWYII